MPNRDDAEDLLAKAEAKVGSFFKDGLDFISGVKDTAVDRWNAGWTPIQRLGADVGVPTKNFLQNVNDAAWSVGGLVPRGPEFRRDVLGKSISDFGKVWQDVAYDSSLGLARNTLESLGTGKALPLEQVLPGASAIANLDSGARAGYAEVDKTKWGQNLSDAYLTAQQLATGAAIGGGAIGLAGNPAVRGAVKTLAPYVMGGIEAGRLRRAIEGAGDVNITTPESPVPTVNVTVPEATTSPAQPESPGTQLATQEPTIINLADAERSAWNDLLGKAVGGLAAGYGRQLAGGGDTKVIAISGGSGPGVGLPNAIAIPTPPKKKKRPNKNKKPEVRHNNANRRQVRGGSRHGTKNKRANSRPATKTGGKPDRTRTNKMGKRQ
jgi:hypothetical protein